MPISYLADVPNVYLVDRDQWPDFKRALNMCGCAWSLPNWKQTIRYKGAEWEQLMGTQAATQLRAIFREPMLEVLNDNKAMEFPIGDLAKSCLNILNLGAQPDEFNTGSLYCDIASLKWEHEQKLPARQKMWTWMLKCLFGPGTSPGNLFYLTKQVMVNDIANLYSKLSQILDRVTICSLEEEVHKVTHLEFNPQKQELLSYVTDLRRAIRRLNDVNEKLRDGSRIIFSDAYVKIKLLRAARTLDMYRSALDAFVAMDADEWERVTSDEMLHKLEVIKFNSAALMPQRNLRDDNVMAHSSVSKDNKPKTKRVCFKFKSKGECNKPDCAYLHTRTPAQTETTKEKKPDPPPKQEEKQANKNKVTCAKCAKDHLTRECKYDGVCNYCKKVGHMESVCKTKKRNGPKVLASSVDGAPASANLFIVNLNTESAQVKEEREAPIDGKFKERFYADTGANRSLHPNSRAAASFYRTTLDINTASGHKSMKTEGVGTMLLYTPSGEPMPGFSKVLFTKQATEKLASVGDLCDAGLICVFDKKGMRTYKAEDLKLSGKVFTDDARDPKNRLYPLSLFRKRGEKKAEDAQCFLLQKIRECSRGDSNPQPSDVTSDARAVAPLEHTNKRQRTLLPLIVADGETLPATLLARTYVKEGLSDLERYHAKFGDVGLKYIHRCVPTVKVPKKYRCEFCIDGKIHKFEHRVKPFEAKAEYLPGTCIHSDHSGPYAKSLSGARYSQLYLDRGSGYLWAKRQVKKTGHYADTPRIFVDAKALSGRDVQIFQTDGDGTFAGKQTDEIMMQFKVRHEVSAPYDSNSNAFVERARRTIFEGVATALLRSGAPAYFWGEAEAHKVFTFNNLPTVPSPENPKTFLSRRNILQGHDRPFPLERLMAFGTAATCYIPVEKRKGGKEPAQRRSFHGVVVGYEEGMPAYRVWDIEARIVKAVSYVFTICHEGYYPLRDKANWEKEWSAAPAAFSPIHDGVLTLGEWNRYEFDDEDASAVLARAPSLILESPDIPENVPRKMPQEVNQGEVAWPPARQPALPPPPAATSPAPFPQAPESASHTPPKALVPSPQDALPAFDSKKTKNFWQKAAGEKIFSVEQKYAEVGELVEVSAEQDKPISIPPPKTFREAMLSPWRKQYFQAAQKEIDGHVKSETWTLIPRSQLPRGKNILRGKWVFTDKRDERGKIVKFKARFVAMGFTQKFGEDFSETFAGVVIGKTFRILLSILNSDPGYSMEHWDVRMAFTQAKLEETLFMEQPEGFASGANLVCRLNKSLYGLKQSARNWQLMLNEIFLSTNFTPLHSDPCVFIRRGEKDMWCICCTHVDDIFVLFPLSGNTFRTELYDKIQSRVEVENLGNVSWALKTNILRDRHTGVLKISQEAYITEILERYGGDKDSFQLTKSSLESPYFGKNFTVEEKKVDEGLKKQIQSMIGALWWLAQISRPDIFLPLHLCSKEVNQPSPSLLKKLQKIFSYLSTTRNYGLVYRRPSQDTPTLSAFVDAAFASEDGELSRVGYLFFHCGNLVSWTSENPKRVMTSSTEVECRGLVEVSKENVWHRQLHLELGLYSTSTPTIVFEDNTSTIHLINHQGTPHKRSKYFGIEWSYVKQSVSLNEMKVEYVDTTRQRADFLTKSLPTPKFQEHRDVVMGNSEQQNFFSTD